MVRGVVTKPPRYYDKLFEAGDAEGMAKVKRRRARESWKRYADQTARRLEDAEKVKQAQVAFLKRKYEKE